MISTWLVLKVLILKSLLLFSLFYNLLLKGNDLKIFGEKEKPPFWGGFFFS